MSEIILTRDVRLSLRAQAHHLDPVVLLGANGLTEAVMKEIDRELKAHELIKVRVPTDDREEREAIYAQVAETLGAARVQMIGKLLIFWRPAEDEAEEDAAARILAAAAAAANPVKAEKTSAAKAAPKKKVASKKPGDKKARKTEAPRRARPKRTRKTKKAMLSGK
ncbi:ribosome assembly RNA-binding protein YhbY [Sutterella massiliensis]|uniref:Ribosome assembly RNA-binding protein YhbY n=1 Tax=Sutterella massiliensis TaxID=1816689 RepID=A0ABS2DRV3_9BURK|nr:ribosome assembly RNA-binding protein YhbY [Sutterella massiliensis]MBM6704071.1 ribosome assembly RNA-binding protein YhbY [Sutterella massiliensis]